MEKIVARRNWWFAISLLIIVPGLISLAVFGLKPSIDFTGGALWDIQFLERTRDQINTEQVAKVFADNGFPGALVQLSEVKVDGKTLPTVLVRTRTFDQSGPQSQQVTNALTQEFGQVRRESLQTVGETVSAESTRSAVIAVLGACVAILAYLTVAFRRAPHPFRYGVCAIAAMLHDVLLVLGVASILGRVTGLEVDALFLTALLTIISFSVHDTIVVFDRVRENLIGRRPGETFEEVVNHSIVQTIPRSINTQLTSMFTLTALLLFGGASIRNFVIILLIGLISGTYSSIFNAAQLLVVWENQEWTGGSRQKQTAAA